MNIVPAQSLIVHLEEDLTERMQRLPLDPGGRPEGQQREYAVLAFDQAHGPFRPAERLEYDPRRGDHARGEEAAVGSQLAGGPRLRVLGLDDNLVAPFLDRPDDQPREIGEARLGIDPVESLTRVEDQVVRAPLQ